MRRKRYSVEQIIGKLRDEVLDRETFSTLREAQVIIERWRTEYNPFRRHSSLGYRPPPPEPFFRTFIVRNMPEMISSPMEDRTLEPLTQQVAHQLGVGQTDLLINSSGSALTGDLGMR